MLRLSSATDSTRPSACAKPLSHRATPAPSAIEMMSRVRRAPMPAAPALATPTQPSAAQPFFPGTPYAPDAPWPAMRGGWDNAGCATALLGKPFQHAAQVPRHVVRLTTGNSIFSTPVIGAGDKIYVGSADKNFYGFDPLNNTCLFRFPTRECNDSAAAIGQDRIYAPSCDGSIYALNSAGKLQWQFDALKEHVGPSPSTIYWWEGNVALGPQGLYAGNDNFYLYNLDAQTGRPRWAAPTGMCIWSVPAFRDNKVYSASFDMHVCAHNASTGQEIWRHNAGNMVAASPALGADGSVYIGTLGGTVMALDGATGKPRWQRQLGGHVYASMAVAPDGCLYVGAADGQFYALDAKTGATLWSFQTGDAIRSSASIGPDPEGLAPYLVYVGSGDGSIYAFDPHGQRRWSYDTSVGSAVKDSQYRNINSSIALGEHGLATGSANGEVLYVPYDCYLQQVPGFCLEPGDGLPADGVGMVCLAPGGARLTDPKLPLRVQGAQTVAMQLQVRRAGQPVEAHVCPESLRASIAPPLKHRLVVQPNGTQVTLVPEELPSPNTVYQVTLHGDCMVQGLRQPLQHSVQLQAQAVANAPSIRALLAAPLHISHMSVYDPSIIASFDQIGIASLSMDVQVVDVNDKTGNLTAWGVMHFAVQEDGSSPGVPSGRRLLFALHGTYRDGHYVLQADKPWFELTAFPVPLDTLRFTGTLPPTGVSQDGGSMLGEVHMPHAKELWANLRAHRWPSAAIIAARVGWQYWQAPKTAAHPNDTWQRTWKMLKRVTGSLGGFLFQQPFRAWGLFNDARNFSGVGTYRSAWGVSHAAPQGVTVQQLAYDEAAHTVCAQLQVDGAPQFATGILLVDADSGQPVSLDYNAATWSEYDATKQVLTVRLTLPQAALVRGKNYRATLLENCTVVKIMEFCA